MIGCNKLSSPGWESWLQDTYNMLTYRTHHIPCQCTSMFPILATAMPHVLRPSQDSPFSQVVRALYKVPSHISWSIYWLWGTVRMKLPYLGLGWIGASNAPILPLFSTTGNAGEPSTEIDVNAGEEDVYSTIEYDHIEPEVSSKLLPGFLSIRHSFCIRIFIRKKV